MWINEVYYANWNEVFEYISQVMHLSRNAEYSDLENAQLALDLITTLSSVFLSEQYRKSTELLEKIENAQ